MNLIQNHNFTCCSKIDFHDINQVSFKCQPGHKDLQNEIPRDNVL